MSSEVFISVDVETSGPIPGEYSLLSIGACVVGDSETHFYREITPTTDKFVPEALAVSKLDLGNLKQSGTQPTDAMAEFKGWIELSVRGGTPVFVGFNAPFDWSFVAYYFHRYLGENPFGFSALDIKAFFMGATGCSWADTRSSRIAKFLHIDSELSHNALEDALAQAVLFEKVLAFGRPHSA